MSGARPPVRRAHNVVVPSAVAAHLLYGSQRDEYVDAFMKAFVIERYGTPDALVMKEVPTPTPKANEILVRVHAASINDWDYGLLLGTSLVNRMMSGLFQPKLHILGCDIAGRVEAIGAGVETLQRGDEVYGDLSSSGFGAFAEYACVPAASVARKPAAMTFEQAAAIPQAGMLAWQGLIDFGHLQRGQKVLLNGAGGGVGTLALQIAKLYEAEITVVDKPGKLDMLRSLGAHHVIDFLEEDFTSGKNRYDLILDVKTNRSPFAYRRALNRGGSYVTVGGSIPRLLQTVLAGPIISQVYRQHARVVPLKQNKDLAQMNELFTSGKLLPVIEGPYRFSDLPEALRLFGTGDHKGKIIVNVS
jgi:NADPH:quinone reductase-like Zn-dependent oxidoreductase